MANTKENPKVECNIVVTTSQGRERVEKKEDKTKGEVESEAKKKDGLKSRQDLVEMGIREQLHPISQGS